MPHDMQPYDPLLGQWPVAVQFDAISDGRAWIVGGALLKHFRYSTKESGDLDVQFDGSVADAEVLQLRLRAAGIPANVRSLQAPGTADMMYFAAGWRRAKYSHGVLVATPTFWEFVEFGVARVITGLPDSDRALKSAQYVLMEYPGTTVVVC